MDTLPAGEPVEIGLLEVGVVCVRPLGEVVTTEYGLRFGEELRSERERRGISIARLCADTKVNQRFIEALEIGDYQALPGGVFRRGFVRAYLKAVGLDEAEWLAKFDLSYAELTRSLGIDREKQEEGWATFAANVKRNRGTPRRRLLKRWLGVLAMAAVLAGAVWAVWHYVLLSHLAR
jgi:cytoskeleton protein RodZ